MFKSKSSKYMIVGLLGLLAVLVVAIPVLAQPPSNDERVDATEIFGLPFFDSLNTTEATAGFDDPFPGCWGPQLGATVWYRFTPADNMEVQATTSGSSYDTVLVVYEDFGFLNEIACVAYQGAVNFSAFAGQTYYFMIGDLAGGGPYYPPPSFGGQLEFSVSEVVPPENDDFANAMMVGSIPFSIAQDNTSASQEMFEPYPSCAWGDLSGSLWYAYTAMEDGSLTASVQNAWFSPVLAVYTGSSLDALSEAGCGVWDPVTFSAVAGETYYFQVSGLYWETGQFQFQLDVPPPPIADFWFWPDPPSTYDVVQFYDNSYDPVWIGIESQMWDFGDGATATGCCPTHQFGADGEYLVQLDVVTFDGRTGSITRTVYVETHDVAITKFSTPNAASAGQTRTITVGVSNKLVDETVEVTLYRSTPGGYEYVGSLIQYVPVRSGGRTTNFKFSYTFTEADAAVGKVTFRVYAQIFGANDALPADNEAISSPTKVK